MIGDLEPGCVVAWRTGAGWSYGRVVAQTGDRASVRPIAGAARANHANRPVRDLVVVLTSNAFESGLAQALHNVLQAVDGAGPGADGGGRR